MLKQLGLLWLLTLFTYANHVHWLGDYDKALEKAQQEHKPLLVLVVKKDAKLCNTILHKQFMNHCYIDTINNKMVAVMVTYGGKTSYPIEMYYTTVFPSLFFVDTQTEMFMSEPLYGEQISQKVLLQYFQPWMLKTKSQQH